jgi:hypothetical protein
MQGKMSLQGSWSNAQIQRLKARIAQLETALGEAPGGYPSTGPPGKEADAGTLVRKVKVP